MFCGNCGRQIADNAKFCGGCGKSQVPNAPVIPVQQVIFSNQQSSMQKQSNGQQSNGQQYQGQQFPGQQYGGNPYSGQPSAAYGTTGYNTTVSVPDPGKKTKMLLTLASVALVAVIILSVVLWFFVFSANPLESTCWVTEDGTVITFTDDINGYYEDDGGKEKFTYTVDDDQLSLHLDDEDKISYTFREEGDWLVLTPNDEDVEIAWCNAEKAFFCAYCEEPGYSDKHTGKFEGEEYDFCENCWENVQRFLD